MSSSVRDIRGKVYLDDKQAGGSLRKLENEAKQLAIQLKNVNKADQNFSQSKYDEKRKRLQQLNGQIRKQKNEIFGVNRGWNNAAGGIQNYIKQLAGITAVAMAVREGIRRASDLSDLRADVQKTTDLTEQEMDDLQSRLEGLNTRTSRRELLKLAAEAGKMGERGVDSISDFVEQANELNVALGDELGDQATRKVAKMADVFNLRMEQMGSGINAVADSTKAGAAFLTEFIARMGGVSKQTGVTAGETLGYAATLDELGLKVEMSSTALNGFLIDFTKNSDRFGEVAGFANGELSKLIGEEGTNTGFLAFLERMKESSETSEEFLRKLEQVGITGDRKAQTFLALAQNIDQLRDRQAMANQEIEKGTSLTEEYNRKNTNFAAKMQKLGNAINEYLVNSEALQFLDRLAGKVLNLVETEETRADKLRQVNAEAQRELQILRTGNFTQEERKKIIDDINTQYGDYLPNLLDEKASIQDISDAQKALNDEMRRRILMAQMQEEIEALTQAQIKAADASLKQKKALADLNDAREQDMSPTQLNQRKALLQTLIRLNDEAVSEAAETEKEIRAKYEQIAKSIDVALSKDQEVEDPDVQSGGDSEDELEARQKAQQKINDFLEESNQKEIEKTRAKFEKLIELARKHGLNEKELRKQMQEELRTMELERDQEAREAEQERQLSLMESSMEQLFNYEKEQLLQQDEFKKLNKQQQQEELENLELAHLQRLLEARRSLGEETADIERKITDIKEGQVQRRKESENELQDSLVQTMAMSAASATAQAEDAGDATSAILNSIRQQIRGFLAKAIAGAIAKEFATKGLLGGLTGAAAVGAATALFDTLIPRFNTGGFTGAGLGVDDPIVPGRKIAGITHDNEYVVAQEELRDPDINRMVEYIEGVRSARTGSFAQGGFTSPGAATTVTNNNTTRQEIRMDRLEGVVGRLASTLDRIERNGIRATYSDEEIRENFNPAQERIRKIEEQSKIG